ncbi:MAG TPA: ferritin-like domain-containing protein [Polyangiaceae bacterium]|nr:ferritin-like domain-containing protein [Polyangiaceae bacterium]
MTTPAPSPAPQNDAPGYDFGGAAFDLNVPQDREIVCFILSQALYGEATAVYCGRSLFAARSLRAAQFYVRQAKQELSHLQLFAEIFRTLEMQPSPAHWVVRLLSTHNAYYPLKVLMEHAVGEGLVLDIFKDVLLQTLPDSDPRVLGIKKKLRVICREEEEHVAWGEDQTALMLKEKPWLRWPYYGLVELQLLSLPWLVRRFRRGYVGHPVLSQLEAFLNHAREGIYKKGRRLGFVPERRPTLPTRLLAMGAGLLLYVRSRFARSSSKLEKIYLAELGFSGRA